MHTHTHTRHKGQSDAVEASDDSKSKKCVESTRQPITDTKHEPTSEKSLPSDENYNAVGVGHVDTAAQAVSELSLGDAEETAARIPLGSDRSVKKPELTAESLDDMDFFNFL